jgi:hypothetical protein
MIFTRHKRLDSGPFVPMIGVDRVGSSGEESLYQEMRLPALDAFDEMPVEGLGAVSPHVANDTPLHVDSEDSVASTL